MAYSQELNLYHRHILIRIHPKSNIFNYDMTVDENLRFGTRNSAGMPCITSIFIFQLVTCKANYTVLKPTALFIPSTKAYRQGFSC